MVYKRGQKYKHEQKKITVKKKGKKKRGKEQWTTETEKELNKVRTSKKERKHTWGRKTENERKEEEKKNEDGRGLFHVDVNVYKWKPRKTTTSFHQNFGAPVTILTKN